MGLDTVELVMEVEDRFGISIPDEEASQVRTAGDFLGCILSHLPHGPAARCHTAAAFYRLRKSMVEVLGVGRRAIRPQTPVGDLLPPGKARRAMWRMLGEKTALRMPELERPRALMVTIFTGAGLLVALIAISLIRSDVHLVAAGVFLGLLSLIPYCLAARRLTKPLAVCIPASCTTAGLLARRILERNYGSFLSDTAGPDEREVWASLRAIISEQLGVKEGDVSLDSRFVEDLGCG